MSEGKIKKLQATENNFSLLGNYILPWQCRTRYSQKNYLEKVIKLHYKHVLWLVECSY